MRRKKEKRGLLRIYRNLTNEKKATGKTWMDIKAGTDNAWQNLEKAYNQASVHFK
jgi:hypothetical protein